MLKRIKVKAPSGQKASTDMPIVDLDGDVVKAYNQASVDAKKAKDIMDDFRPEIVEAGVGAVIARNLENPATPVASARLVDSTGASVMVSFTSKYSSQAGAGQEAVEEFFSELSGTTSLVDINECVQETVKAKFDDSVFLDVTGVFSKTKYDKYRMALEKVARDLGDVCPLSVAKVLLPLDRFHAARWALFPSFGLQMKLAQVLPNTVVVKSIAPVDGVAK